MIGLRAFMQSYAPLLRGRNSFVRYSILIPGIKTTWSNLVCLLLFISSPAVDRHNVDTNKKKFETVINLGKWSQASLDSLILKSQKTKSLSSRVDYISSRFLGTLYAASTLIGDCKTPERFVVNLAGMDCFTFVDYVMALSVAGDYKDFVRKLQDICYADGIVSFKTRNHFFTQWIENNRRYINDFGKTLENAVCMPRKLNKKGRQSYWLDGISVIEKQVCHIPRKEVNDMFYACLKTGDIIGFHTELDGLDVTHMGFVIRKDGEVVLRHASSKQKKIVDEGLVGYIAKNAACDGLMVARPVEKDR